ncbi:WG repeat-containing protein [Taibaiella chishuiensis]|uniref:WG repeat protein n=1 Tax=Taibaiella chishuiensis TaxID=1434707 RepID=A0A2P8D1N1_9BACT|nr:WG repeat-containing protein [Taibaiella chishuiensis]PSK91112.1 WG repeat protein [Taibaiella chishuiensis]
MNRFFALVFLLLPVACLAQRPADYWVAYTDTSSGDPLTGYKSLDGNIAIAAKYLWASDTFYTMAIVFDQGWIGINRKQEIILRPFIFDNGPDYVVEGLFRFVEGEKMGFADPDGHKVIPARYDFVTPFEEGLAAYTLGGYKQYDQSRQHWWWTGGYEQGFVNRDGQEFREAGPLQGKRRKALTREGKPVVLDGKGRIIKK